MVFESKFGFKYNMDEATYFKLLEADSSKSPTPLDNAECYIKYAKCTTGFISLLVFLCVSTITNYWLYTGLSMIALSFIGVIFSYSVLYLITAKWLLMIYEVINNFYIKYILVALFSWFYLENWIMIIVFIVANLISHLIDLWFTGGGRRMRFNNKIAERALNKRLY